MFTNKIHKVSKASIGLTGVGFLLLVAMPATAGLFDDKQTQQAVANNRSSIQTLDARVGSVESKLGDRADRRQVADLLQQIQMLQEEIRLLRGQVEEQIHANQQLKRRQGALYADLEDRLLAVERRGADGGLAASGGSAFIAETPVAAAQDLPAQQSATADTQTATSFSAPAGGSAEQAGERYKEALSALRSKDYRQATRLLKSFLTDFSGDKLAGNAQYWLGETYYVTRDFPTAVIAFERVASHYPASRKNPGALLKLGYIQHEMGNLDGAKSILEQVTQRYPESTEARLASQRVKELEGSSN